MAIKIVGIAGSLRAGSFNRKLLHAAARAFPAGVAFTIWDGLDRIPAFNEDRETEPVPLAVAELRRLIGDADALLIATPEYNGSVPGALKNALDWASRPRGAAVVEGKPVAVMSASPTPYGGARAQADLRKVLKVMGAQVCASQLAVPEAFRQFDQAGDLTDPGLRDRLDDVVEELLSATGTAERAASA